MTTQQVAVTAWDKIKKALASGAFWGAILTTVGGLDWGQVITVVSPAKGAMIAVVGMVVSAFSRALHDALKETPVEPPA